MNATVKKRDIMEEKQKIENPWKSIYAFGGATTLIVLAGTLLDIITGSVLGGDLEALPKNAIARFAQFQANSLLGLYNLDLLNATLQIIMIPSYLALYAAHRKAKRSLAALGLVVFLVGTAIFVTNNTALPMMDLSAKYAAASTDAQKTLLAAAGEAMLVRGAHGSPGVFIGFVMPTLAGFIMSFTMLTGKIFGRVNAWFGIAGSALMMVYIVLVTFVPGVKSMAVGIAAPGGIMLMAWMAMFAIRLFKLGKAENG